MFYDEQPGYTRFVAGKDYDIQHRRIRDTKCPDQYHNRVEDRARSINGYNHPYQDGGAKSELKNSHRRGHLHKHGSGCGCGNKSRDEDVHANCGHDYGGHDHDHVHEHHHGYDCRCSSCTKDHSHSGHHHGAGCQCSSCVKSNKHHHGHDCRCSSCVKSNKHHGHDCQCSSCINSHGHHSHDHHGQHSGHDHYDHDHHSEEDHFHLTTSISQNRRVIEGELDDELPYSDYNHLPVAAGYKSHAYEYGYSMIPPEKWFKQPVRPPICVTEKRCPTMPSYTTGVPVDTMEWHSSRRVTQPDMISVKYVQDKLNSGR